MPIHSFLGSWRILETELWEQSDLDEIVEAHLTLESHGLGEFAFLCVRADVDYRVVEREGLPGIEFSFVGEDEMDPVSGRGWAVLAEDELRGRLFFHRGDDSAFVARRKRSKQKTLARKRLG